MPSYDSAWKDIVKEQLRPFLEFFFPLIAAGIDFSRCPEFLDKELEKLIPESRQPGRYADLLIRTALKDPPRTAEEEENRTHTKVSRENSSPNKEPRALLLCHIEVQGSEEAGFAERLFQYALRIYSRHGTFPATLVVLTDRSPSFRPEEFRIDSPYVRLSLAFHVAKILDYRDRREELNNSDNPFAFVVEAQLQLHEMQRRREKERRAVGKENPTPEKEQRAGESERQARERDPQKGERDLDLQEQRYILKERLMLGLLRRGFEKSYVRSLIRFLDWMLRLPEKKETLLQESIEEERGGADMPYVTSWERIAEKKGIKEGEKKGKRKGEEKGKLVEKQQVLIRLLEKKFGLSAEERARIEETGETEKLDRALDEFVFADSKREVLEKL